MHSRVFGLSEERDYCNSVSESDLYDGFCGAIADHVDTVPCARIFDNIAWLVKFSKGALEAELDGNAEDGIYRIRVVDKDAYFAGKYQEFVKALHDLKNVLDRERFADGRISLEMYRLNSRYDDEYGYYMMSEDGVYQTFDSWMREKKNGDVVFCSKVFDYHF